MAHRRIGSRLLAVRAAAFALFLCAPLTAAVADDVGQIKVSNGVVYIERGGHRLPGQVGAKVSPSDVVVTGADGSVGIAFADDSLLSLGPNSVLAIDRLVFDSTTHRGGFESSLKKGTLAAVSGKIARQAPGAMKVKTPAAILGVRGTQFLVRTSESSD